MNVGGLRLAVAVVVLVLAGVLAVLEKLAVVPAILFGLLAVALMCG
jgi:hypothetical protein